MALIIWCKGFEKIQSYSKISLYFVGNYAKGKISKRVFQETKHVKFSEQRTFYTPRYAHVRVLISG